MARKPVSSSRPERPQLTAAELRNAVVRIRRRVEELEGFDPATITQRFKDPEQIRLETAIKTTLHSIFGVDTAEYSRYARATRLDHGPVSVSSGSSWVTGRVGYGSEPDFRHYLSDGRMQAIALLNQAVSDLEEELEFAEPDPAPAHLITKPERQFSRKVFIVHGHDEGAREAVARYVTDLGFDPVVLHEQPNRGGTVIEKIEANADVGFAVVLLTPDDEGRVKGGELEARVRQNVLLELGYFLAHLGRSKVCALRKGNVAIPSDFAGVVWEAMDAGQGWKLALGKELKAAGFEVDLNKAFG